MKKGFQPASGADGWQLSNAPILSLATYLASAEIFEKAGIENLVKRSKVLTAYLEFLLLNSVCASNITIITPSNPDQRGCQLSVIFKNDGKELFQKLQENHIMVDWREPNVIRITPVPLYNSFIEIYNFVKILEAIS
jgi:kynureninase